MNLMAVILELRLSIGVGGSILKHRYYQYAMHLEDQF